MPLWRNCCSAVKGVGIPNKSNKAKDSQLPVPAAPKAGQWEHQDDDVRLMLRFKAGEAEAFDELVARNTPKVHALVFRFLGEPSLVEDLTQEVFVRIYRTAKRYQPSAKFGTWLYRIAANLSFNALRSRKKGQARQFKAAEGEEFETFSQEIPDCRLDAPDERLDSQELGQKVAQAIDKLPENQKVAIILNKYEFKSYEEIAEVLQCSTMAVKSLLSRARCNLRDSLRTYLDAE